MARATLDRYNTYPDQGNNAWLKTRKEAAILPASRWNTIYDYCIHEHECTTSVSTQEVKSKPQSHGSANNGGIEEILRSLCNAEFESRPMRIYETNLQEIKCPP